MLTCDRKKPVHKNIRKKRCRQSSSGLGQQQPRNAYRVPSYTVTYGLIAFLYCSLLPPSLLLQFIPKVPRQGTLLLLTADFSWPLNAVCSVRRSRSLKALTGNHPLPVPGILILRVCVIAKWQGCHLHVLQNGHLGLHFVKYVLANL